MTGYEIKQRIDENNRLIESIMAPNIFTLNNSISELLKENDMLQSQCKHFFEDGYCRFCYKGQA